MGCHNERAMTTMIVTLSQCMGKGYVVSKSGRCLCCHNESETEIPICPSLAGKGLHCHNERAMATFSIIIGQ